jgi:hypothetical protein
MPCSLLEQDAQVEVEVEEQSKMSAASRMASGDGGGDQWRT